MLLRTYVPMPALEGLRNLSFDSGVAVSANFNQIELRREDEIMGMTLVSASLTVMPYFGGTPQFTKTITPIFNADGQITDDGSATGVAACRFDFSIGELTSVVPRAFLLEVTDSIGRVTKYDSGYLVPNGVEPETPVDHIVISPTELMDVPVGTVIQFGAAAYDLLNQVLPGRVLTYASSDPAVATVSQVGTMTAVSVGATTITASGGGQQAAARMNVVSYTVLRATFTDGTGVDLDGWACDTGQVLEAINGDWEIEGNRAKATAGTFPQLLGADTGITDFIVQAEMPVLGDGNGVFGGCSDAANLLLVIYSLPTVLSLFKVEAGSFTSLDAIAHTATAGEVMAFERRGSTLTGYIDGVELLSASDAFNPAATKQGILASDGAERFDTLTVFA